jgi:hypothetical protein
MGRRALGCFEDREDGRWICIRSTVVEGPAGRVAVTKGQSFVPRSVFAGYDDFTSYLASVSIEGPPTAPHEW